MLFGNSIVEGSNSLIRVSVEAGRNVVVSAAPHIAVRVADGEVGVAVEAFGYRLEVVIARRYIFCRSLVRRDGSRDVGSRQRHVRIIRIRRILHVSVCIRILVLLAFAEQYRTTSVIVGVFKYAEVHVSATSVGRNVVVAGVVFVYTFLDTIDVSNLLLTCHVVALDIYEGVVNELLELVCLVLLVRHLVLKLLCDELSLSRVVAVVALRNVVDAEVNDAVVGIELHVGKPYRLADVVTAVDSAHRTVLAEDVQIHLLQHIGAVVGEVEREQHVVGRVVPRV